ncbi:MAG TPA: hypothetical protein VFQ61_28190 [Polyangiaceae bacterium]|nr:hypothetical protein [Polyangiaceae bacterium]
MSEPFAHRRASWALSILLSAAGPGCGVGSGGEIAPTASGSSGSGGNPGTSRNSGGTTATAHPALPNICTRAQARCTERGTLEVCDGGRFVPQVECGDFGRCNAAHKSCLACAPGTFRCTGAVLEQCELEGLSYQVVRRCGEKETCHAEGELGYCEICSRDAMYCEAFPGSAPSLRSCNALGSGTQEAERCDSSAPLCDARAGRCRTCVPGRATCELGKLLKCDEAGAQLNLVEDCGHRELCDAELGVCKSNLCNSPKAAPGSVVCRGTTETELSICRANGQWELLDVCSSPVACELGLAVKACPPPELCAAGIARCSGSELQHCVLANSRMADENGYYAGDAAGYVTIAHCTRACVEDGATPAHCESGASNSSPYVESLVCVPGATEYERCDSEQPQCQRETCTTGELCANGTLGCRRCVPGALRCDGTRLVQCSRTGEREQLLQDCGPEACDAYLGRCLPAAAGERYCEGPELKLMARYGTPRVLRDCGDAAACDPIQGCLAASCEPGTSTCSSDKKRAYVCETGQGFSTHPHLCLPGSHCEEGFGCVRPVRVTAGAAHTCVLFEGELGRDPEQDPIDVPRILECWGANESGQLANGSSLNGDEPQPRAVVFASEPSSSGSTPGLYPNAAGANAPNSGAPNSAAPGSGPANSSLLRSNIRFSGGGLCAGRDFTCADVWFGPSPGFYDVVCWGANQSGQLGNGVKPDAKATEVENRVQFPASRYAIFAGGSPTGSAASSSAPGSSTSTPPARANFPELFGVTCGSDFACALDAKGQAYCWGGNAFGQLGTGSAGSAGFLPTLVSSPESFVSLAAGGRHICGTTANDLLLCWGANDFGQAGQDTRIVARASPVGEQAVSQLALGRDFTLAVTARGSQPLVFGNNWFGQLAVLGSTVKLPVMAELLPSDSPDWLVSGPNAAHVCGSFDSSLYCWGANHAGQAGSALLAQLNEPTELEVALDLEAPRQLALGEAHSCALLRNNDVLCWGSNQRGQLGLTPSALRETKPTRVEF